MYDYRFASWNVDSLNAALTGTSDRAQMSRAVLETLGACDFDVVALQETKLPSTGPTAKHLVELESIFPGHDIDWVSSSEPARKGYSGSLLLCRSRGPTPIITTPAIDAPHPMTYEGRVITAEFPQFYFTSVYTPNAGAGLGRLGERQEWDVAYRRYLTELDAIKPVIACGDFNVAHREIDLARPGANRGSAGFTDEERAGFDLLLAAGFTDTFRHVHGDIAGAYSWFHQVQRTSKVNNTGWRIDYFLVSDRIADRVVAAGMVDTGARQDHVPVTLELADFAASADD